MLKRENKVSESTFASKVCGFSTNPIQANPQSSKSFDLNNDINIANIPEAVDFIYSLNEVDIRSLMAHNNEIVRGIAARAFVDKGSELLVDTIKIMLSDTNESLRDSAVESLCYLNSPDVFDLLEESTRDISDKVKLKSLAGIADLAIEHSLEKAKDILRSFKDHTSKEIREFVRDELSIMQ